MEKSGVKDVTPVRKQNEAGQGLYGVDDKPQPSQYLQSFVKSHYKKTVGQGSLNDSLDKMKLEFMQGYNDVMQESDTAFRLES